MMFVCMKFVGLKCHCINSVTFLQFVSSQHIAQFYWIICRTLRCFEHRYDPIFKVINCYYITPCTSATTSVIFMMLGLRWHKIICYSSFISFVQVFYFLKDWNFSSSVSFTINVRFLRYLLTVLLRKSFDNVRLQENRFSSWYI